MYALINAFYSRKIEFQYFILLIVSTFSTSCGEEVDTANCSGDTMTKFSLNENWIYTGSTITIKSSQPCINSIESIRFNSENADFTQEALDGRNIIVEVPILPQGNIELVVEGIDGTIFLRDSIEVYPGTLQWVEIAEFPSSEFFGYKTFNFQNKAFLMNGSSSNSYDPSLYKYDLQLNQWTLESIRDEFREVGNPTVKNNSTLMFCSDGFGHYVYDINRKDIRQGIRLDECNTSKIITLDSSIYSLFYDFRCCDANESLIPYLTIGQLNDFDQYDSLLSVEDETFFEPAFAFGHLGNGFFGINNLITQQVELWKFNPSSRELIQTDSFFGFSSGLQFLFKIGQLAYFVEKSEVDFNDEIRSNGSNLFAYNLVKKELTSISSNTPIELILPTSMQIGDRGFQGLNVSKNDLTSISSRFFEGVPR